MKGENPTSFTYIDPYVIAANANSTKRNVRKTSNFKKDINIHLKAPEPCNTRKSSKRSIYKEILTPKNNSQKLDKKNPKKKRESIYATEYQNSSLSNSDHSHSKSISNLFNNKTRKSNRNIIKKRSTSFSRSDSKVGAHDLSKVIPPLKVLQKLVNLQSNSKKSVKTDSSTSSYNKNISVSCHNEYSPAKLQFNKENPKRYLFNKTSLEKNNYFKLQEDSINKLPDNQIRNSIKNGVFGLLARTKQYHNQENAIIEAKKDVFVKIEGHKAFQKLQYVIEKADKSFVTEDFIEKIIKIAELEKRIRHKTNYFNDDDIISNDAKDVQNSGGGMQNIISSIGKKNFSLTNMQNIGESFSRRKFLHDVKLAYRTLEKTKHIEMISKKWSNLNDNELNKKKQMTALARQENFLINLYEKEQEIIKNKIKRMKSIKKAELNAEKSLENKNLNQFFDGGPVFKKNIKIIRALKKQKKKYDVTGETKEEIKKIILKFLIKNHDMHDYEEFFNNDEMLSSSIKDLLTKERETYNKAFEDLISEKMLFENNRITKKKKNTLYDVIECKFDNSVHIENLDAMNDFIDYLDCIKGDKTYENFYRHMKQNKVKDNWKKKDKKPHNPNDSTKTEKNRFDITNTNFSLFHNTAKNINMESIAQTPNEKNNSPKKKHSAKQQGSPQKDKGLFSSFNDVAKGTSELSIDKFNKSGQHELGIPKNLSNIERSELNIEKSIKPADNGITLRSIFGNLANSFNNELKNMADGEGHPIAVAINKVHSLKIENLEKKKRKKYIYNIFKNDTDPENEQTAMIGGNMSTEHPNDLDYLYMMSYI